MATIPANPRFALPAGMTDFLVLGESFFCSVSRLGSLRHSRLTFSVSFGAK